MDKYRTRGRCNKLMLVLTNERYQSCCQGTSQRLTLKHRVLHNLEPSDPVSSAFAASGTTRPRQGQVDYQFIVTARMCFQEQSKNFIIHFLCVLYNMVCPINAEFSTCIAKWVKQAIFQLQPLAISVLLYYET